MRSKDGTAIRASSLSAEPFSTLAFGATRANESAFGKRSKSAEASAIKSHVSGRVPGNPLKRSTRLNASSSTVGSAFWQFPRILRIVRNPIQGRFTKLLPRGNVLPHVGKPTIAEGWSSIRFLGSLRTAPTKSPVESVAFASREPQIGAQKALVLAPSWPQISALVCRGTGCLYSILGCGCYARNGNGPRQSWPPK
jgi:hypothetical protein